MRLVPTRWRDLQHYKDRRPPWIKFHKSLLDDMAFMGLPVLGKALVPLLWLMASESEADNGEFDADVGKLEFRLRLTRKEIESGVKMLVDAGLMVVASGSLAAASTLQADDTRSVSSLSTLRLSPEEEQALPAHFQSFWKAYDYAKDKKGAMKVWTRIAPSPELAESIIAKAAAYAASTPEKKFRAHPSTWLNRDGWTEEIVAHAANGKPLKRAVHIQNMPLGTASCGCDECVAFRAKRKVDPTTSATG